MPLLEDRTAVFIVRLWCECGDSETAVVWRGSVEHVRTGERRFFQQFDDLIAFMRHVQAGLGPGAPRIAGGRATGCG